MPRFLKNKPAMDKFLDIVLRYPSLTANGPKGSLPSAEPGFCDVHLPSLC